MTFKVQSRAFSGVLSGVLSGILVGVILCVFPCFSVQENGRAGSYPEVSKEGSVVSAQIAGTSFYLEVVSSPEGLARGLMERRALAHRTGMLFLFPKQGRYCFWMKNTRIPLDLLFLDPHGHILEMRRNLQPFSLVRHCASVPVRAAIEIPAGTLDKLQVRSGMVVAGYNFVVEQASGDLTRTD